MLYRVRLYCLHTNAADVLVYGYATQTNETHPSMWQKGGVSGDLRSYNCVITEGDLATWCDLLGGAEVVLPTDKGEVRLFTGGLIARPPVIALGQSLIESGTPHSLSDQLAYVESYWQLDKAGLLMRAWPEDNSSVDFSREQKTFKLLQAMLRDTGIRFLDEDAGRFGNVEVVRYPAGSYDVPSGLRVQTGRSISPPGAHEVLVWLTTPLVEQEAMNIGCRLFNGGGTANETLILDEVRPWPPTDGGVLRFQTAEPISTCEVSVWSVVSHQLLAREKFGVVRGIGLNVRVAQESRRINSPWVRKLSRALQDQAAKVDKVENLQSRHLRGPSDDPWVEAERNWRSELDPLRPSAEAEFFEATQDQEVKLMDFLRDLIDASDVERAVIVDPYFDTEALEKLPLRLQSTRNVVAITSCLEEAESDPGMGPSEAALSPCQALVTTCDQWRKQLPPSFTILSVENEARSAKQFHDRYILLELAQGERVWMLSNSLNSIGRHYPATVTRLPAPVAAKVRGYLNDLEDRRRKERSDAKVRTIWEQPSHITQHASPTATGGPLGLELFPGWQNILRSLAPAEKDDASRAMAAVQSGQLTMNGDVLTWLVPTESVPQVLRRVHERMAPDGVPSVEGWTALAYWAYHGGPDARTYAFATSTLDAACDRLRDLLTQAEATERVDMPDLSGSSAMDVCFRRAASVWEHAAWLRMRRDPVAGFSVEYLWHHAPGKTIEMIEQQKSWLLLAWLLNYLGYSHSEEDARRFLSSKSGFLQALGLAMVWTQAGQAKWSQGIVARCRNLMSECSVSPQDSFLMTTRLAVETWVKTHDAAAIQEVGACWPADGMSEQLRDRFLTGVSDAAWMHLVQAGVELLAVCPVLLDARWMKQSLIDSVLGRFPYNGETQPAYRPGGQGPHIHRETDGPATDLVARLLWEQHGDGTVDWCVANVLDRLAFGKINAQLLRVQDYSLWAALTDGLVWGLLLCAAVVEAAPRQAERTVAIQSLANAIADTFFDDLERHVWWYSDTYSFVWSLLLVLGRWADGPDCLHCLERMTTALHAATLPLAARLTICLSSRRLAQSEQLELETIASGGTLAIDQAIRWRVPGLRRLAENLRDNVSDAAILERLIEALGRVEPLDHPMPWQ